MKLGCLWMVRFIALSCLCGLMVGFVAKARSAEPEQIDVFTSGSEGYHTFRIPALLVTKKDTLLAFCEGRKTGRGDHGDLDLVLKRSTDGGKTWGPLILIHEEGGDAKITIGNPCPVVDQSTGTIWLPFCRDNNDVFVTSSTDDGVTWSKPRDITRDVKLPGWGWYATGPGVGIQLTRGPHKGRLVTPCDHKRPIDGKVITFSHVIFSDDHGQTWKLGQPVAPHTNECQVAELPDGSVLINMRNYVGKDGGQPERGNIRAVATSRDGGVTWDAVRYDATLIEPVCQASLIRYSWPEAGGRSRLLFSNPASKTRRAELTVRLSDDEGKTWSATKLLYAGSAAYSCLTPMPDEQFGIIFERDDYKFLTFVRLPLKWIQ